jgi:hypothetical protein
MLAIVAVMAAPAATLLLPASAHAANAKYMADSTNVVPGGKIGCPAGRREYLENKAGLLPCIEDTTPLQGTPPRPEITLKNCAGGQVAWNISGNTCSGPIGASTHGGVATAIANNGNTGSAQYQCNNGTWYGPFSGTCVPPVSCPETVTSWPGTDGICAGTLPKTRAYSSASATGVHMVTNYRPGNSPSASNGLTAVCQPNGKWQVTGQRCEVVPNGCDAKKVYWDDDLKWDTSKCYGDLPKTMSGQVMQIANENKSKETGHPDNYARWSCQDGNWSIVTGACKPEKVDPQGDVYPVYMYTSNYVCDRYMGQDGCVSYHYTTPELRFCGVYAEVRRNSTFNYPEIVRYHKDGMQLEAYAHYTPDWAHKQWGLTNCTNPDANVNQGPSNIFSSFVGAGVGVNDFNNQNYSPVDGLFRTYGFDRILQYGAGYQIYPVVGSFDKIIFWKGFELLAPPGHN